MSGDLDDITQEEAEALLNAAQEVVGLATQRGREITPRHVVASVLAIIETAHASLMAAAVLAKHGAKADAHALEHALAIAEGHLRHFAQNFIENGVTMIKSGEIPAEMLDAIPALRPEEKAQ